jgi:hypothetical protein
MTHVIRNTCLAFVTAALAGGCVCSPNPAAPVGWVRGYIKPASAVEQQAGWQIDHAVMHDSGSILGAKAGRYQVRFNRLPSPFERPLSFDVPVYGGKLTTFTAYYRTDHGIPIPPRIRVSCPP